MVFGLRRVPTTAFLAFVPLAACLGETDLMLPYFASTSWTFPHAMDYLTLLPIFTTPEFWIMADVR
jgi:hypothetical protein